MNPVDTLQRLSLPARPDVGLLFLRLAAAFMLLYVHGVPKLLHYSTELAHIDDPLHLGRRLTLWLALLAEIVCPLLIAAGMLTRLACLPIIFLLLVSMLMVHPDWSIAEGQFGWLLLIAFTAIALAGPGAYACEGIEA